MYARYPHIKQVGLCHSVQGTAEELAHDPISTRRICAIAAQASTIWRSICRWRKKRADGSYVSIYPDMLQAFADGRAPKHRENSRCQNIVRYEMFKSWATS